eukprot:scaffold387229_cov18-Prasinocladus_malaysianus.AAC.1
MAGCSLIKGCTIYLGFLARALCDIHAHPCRGSSIRQMRRKPEVMGSVKPGTTPARRLDSRLSTLWDMRIGGCRG